MVEIVKILNKCYNTFVRRINMHSEKYRKIFPFKALDYDDVDRLLNIFKNIENLKIEGIIVSRKL